MFQRIVKKYNMNVHGMLRNGTVAIVTMFGVVFLFGIKNIMLAFPIALTSTVLGRQNLYVKTFSKIFRITLIDLAIVLTSFISTINIWVGIPINFIAIFLIMYMISSPYDPTYYKPFIMLYIFTQYASVSLYELPARLYSVIFGVIIVVLGSYIKKVNEKSVLGNSIRASFKLIKKQLINILNGTFDEKLLLNCSKLMRELVYRIYVTRHRKYLTTNLGTIQFKIYIYIEHLNLSLREIYEEYNNKEESKKIIENLLLAINKILDYSAGKMTTIELVDSLKRNVEKNKVESVYYEEISNIILGLAGNIYNIANLDDKEINRIYKEWERSNLDRTRSTFKEYFNLNSIRFKFAMRMSLTLTATILVGQNLGYYKVIWAIITIMSIMQPYYEDTLTKAKDRVRGNVIAIIVVGILIYFVDKNWFTIVILIISLYLLYAFKEYSRISLFAASASICIASLTENVNKLIIFRVAYVFVGVVIVLIANRIIFPYRMRTGIEQLISKIKRYNKYLMEHSKAYLKGKNEVHEIRDLIIHSTLLSEKLYLRNLQYGDDEVSNFISKNNELVIEVGYKLLMSGDKDYKKEDIIKLFNNL